MASAAGYVGGLLRLVLTGFACHNAYDIRMSAIRTYGLVIHEFDPWFNMRATQYLADNGPKAFFTWFDYRSWYPPAARGHDDLPGMQLASVAIWRVLNELIGYEMSLNDVCVYVPVWFGLLAATELVVKAKRAKAELSRDAAENPFSHLAAVAGAGFAVILALFSTGFFGPISSRAASSSSTRARATRSSTPSRSTSRRSAGALALPPLHGLRRARRLVVVLVAGAFDAKTFIALYAVAAYFFANKMALLGAPETAKKAKVDDKKAKKSKGKKADDDDALLDDLVASSSRKKPSKRIQRPPGKKSAGGVAAFLDAAERSVADAQDAFRAAAEPLVALGKAPKFARRGPSSRPRRWPPPSTTTSSSPTTPGPWPRACRSRRSCSAHLRNGTPVMVDDYREAYWWLRDNTPEDARVMAWWDYGYQIAGIANRTTIADGNTWNHEHIATLGRCLTSPEKSAHKIVRHLAHVLIWTGGGGDDLAKSPTWRASATRSRTSTRSATATRTARRAYMARMEGRAPAEGGGYKPPKYFEIADDYDEDDYVEDDGVAPLEEFDAEADAAAAADYAARVAEAQAADWKAWSNNEDTTRMCAPWEAMEERCRRPKRKASRVVDDEEEESCSLDDAARLVADAARVLVVSGSGISAAAGLSTYVNGGVYERARKKYKLKSGIELFNYGFYASAPRLPGFRSLAEAVAAR
ncbi:oligosaccharyl transferase [Aureococcus anophagefferens]|nr:oligosaccharyl transferase [Aureococcus anophagefferens]